MVVLYLAFCIRLHFLITSIFAIVNLYVGTSYVEKEEVRILLRQVSFNIYSHSRQCSSKMVISFLHETVWFLLVANMCLVGYSMQIFML